MRMRKTLTEDDVRRIARNEFRRIENERFTANTSAMLTQAKQQGSYGVTATWLKTLPGRLQQLRVEADELAAFTLKR